jgi:hypothetical protein
MGKREFKVWAGCLTHGMTDLTLDNICDNPKCVNRNLFMEAFKEAIQKGWRLDENQT